MLVLTRKVGQAILIGSDVAVTILNVRGDRVKIGIAAPAAIEILREELVSQVHEANLAASLNPQHLSRLLPQLNGSLEGTRSDSAPRTRRG